MRNDLQMQLIGDDHEQRSIATVEPPEINVRHSLSPIKTRRVEIFSAGVVRPRNRIIDDPEARRVDTSSPNISWSETQFVQISLNAPKTGNGVPRMLASNVLKNAAGWQLPMIHSCRETGVHG
jgi:hypothetical protein